jgi:hypothetical protein
MPAQICGYRYGRAASGLRSCRPIASANVVGRKTVAKARARVEGSSVKPATSTHRGLIDYHIIISVVTETYWSAGYVVDMVNKLAFTY